MKEGIGSVRKLISLRTLALARRHSEALRGDEFEGGLAVAGSREELN